MSRSANSQTIRVTSLFTKLEEQRDRRVLWGNIQKVIDEAVPYLEKNLGCPREELDFSKRSLPLVESKLREKWKLVGDQVISLSDDEIITLMKMVGVYVGETWARERGGHWKVDWRYFIRFSDIIVPKTTEADLCWAPVDFVIWCWDECFAEQQDCFVHEIKALERLLEE
jgi:hypothetical protein